MICSVDLLTISRGARHPWRRLTAALGVAATVFVGVALMPSSASAATYSSFCSGSLGAYGECYLSSAFNVSYVEIDANHNSVCIGAGAGLPPYPPTLQAFPPVCAVSGGSAAATENATGYPYVENKHSYGVTVYTSTHFNYR